MAQNVLTFQERQINAGATSRSIVNVPKAWAAINRKNARHTDTKGYLQTYILRVEMQSVTMLSNIWTAPETWVLKNGVRKWHAARNKWLESMGAQVGEYGRTIRPYLNANHQTSDNSAAYYELQPVKYSGAMSGGTWDFTKVVLPQVKNDSGSLVSDGDDAELVLAGSHTVATGTGVSRFSKISMMQSYLESRRNQIGSDLNDDTMDSIETDPSPLLQYMTGRDDYELSLEVVEALQEQAAPYSDSGSGATGTATDATDMYAAGLLKTTATYGRDAAIIRAPGGMFEILSTNEGSSAVIPQIQVEVLGITRSEG